MTPTRGNTPKCRIVAGIAAFGDPGVAAQAAGCPCSDTDCAKRRSSPSSAPAETSDRCAPSSPSRSALRITARPTGWSRPSISTCRSTRPRRGCARRCAEAQSEGARRPPRWCSTATASISSSLKLDGEPLAADRYVATPDSLTIAQPPQRPFPLEIETVVDPSANTQLMGLYRSGATYCTQCEAEGFRRITYFPDRPDVMAVYTTRIEADKAECPVLLANGNLVASGDVPAPAGISRSGTIRSRSRPICSRWSAATSPASRTASAPCRAATSRCASIVEPGKEDRCAYAMDALKRSMRWDEETFGREYDLDIFMIVAVSDFNMGAMENKGLNVFNDKYVLASRRDRDRHRLRGHRGDHRPRVFPQLDRQPHHLPRLVPALPQGRAHRLPRPGIHRRPALAPGRAHPRRARPARASSSSRTPARSPIRCGRASIARSTISTRRPSTRRAPRSCACSRRCSAREDFRKGMDLYFARHDGEAATVEQFVQCFADAAGVDLVAVHAVVFAGRHARGHRDRRATMRARKTYRLEIAQTVPPTPGQPAKEPMLIPLARRPGRPRRPRPAAQARRRRTRRARHPCSAQARRSLSCSRTSPSRRCCRSTATSRRRCALVANPSGDDLRFLAAHDPDPFNRWQAMQIAGDAAPGRQRRPRSASGGAAAPRRRPARCARRDPRRRVARARLRRAGADAAERGRHRPRDRARRRSRRDLRGARRVARRCRARISRRAAGSLPRAHRRRALPAGRRRRRTPRAAQRLPRPHGRSAGAGRDRARRAAVSRPPTT